MLRLFEVDLRPVFPACDRGLFISFSHQASSHKEISLLPVRRITARMTDCEFTLGSHINRAFTCQIRIAEPTKKEAKTLDDKDVAPKILRSYYVWRRSSLLIAMPFIFIGMIFGLIDMVTQLSNEDNKAVFNGFGKFLIFIQTIDSTVLFIGMVVGLVWWNQFTKSVRVVRVAFLASFIMPLIPALFPLELTLNTETRYAISLEENEDYVFSFKLLSSIGYMLTLLPIIISFPGGMVRASLRIRWLLPESMLSGWILVISAPFYSTLLCIALIVALQVAGNFLLFLGTLLVVSAPWLYVIKGNLFVHLWTEEKKKLVFLVQRISGITTLIGYALIIIFAYTGDVSGVGFIGKADPDDPTSKTYLLSHAQAFRIYLETIGRLFVTTLMFSDTILRMNIENWQDFETSKLINEAEIMEHFKAFISAFHDQNDTAKDGQKKVTDAAEPVGNEKKVDIETFHDEGATEVVTQRDEYVPRKAPVTKATVPSKSSTGLDPDGGVNSSKSIIRINGP